MEKELIWGIMLPFIGTTLGADCVFIMGGTFHIKLRRALAGFVATDSEIFGGVLTLTYVEVKMEAE